MIGAGEAGRELRTSGVFKGKFKMSGGTTQPTLCNHSVTITSCVPYIFLLIPGPHPSHGNLKVACRAWRASRTCPLES